MNIHGKYVTLRAVEESDLNLLQEMMNDDKIGNAIVGFAYPVSAAQQRKWFENNVGCCDPLQLIIDTDTDGAIGLISLRNFNWINRSAEIGFKTLESKNTNPGIILDAYETLLKFAFNQLNLHRIDGSIAEYNMKTFYISKRYGAVIEGTKRDAIFRNGRYWNLNMISILEADFKNVQIR